MTKTLTEQWREGTLTGGFYYIQLKDERWPLIDHTDYNLLSHKIEWKDFDWRAVEEVIEEVPCYEEYKELVSKTDELVQKIHILNEQNTKQYNELCEEIKKNNILEKQLAIATKALKNYESAAGWGRKAFLALKEMEGVK